MPVRVLLRGGCFYYVNSLIEEAGFAFFTVSVLLRICGFFNFSSCTWEVSEILQVLQSLECSRLYMHGLFCIEGSMWAVSSPAALRAGF